MQPTQNLWYHDVTSASSTNTAAPRTHGVTQTPCPHIKSNINSRCYVQQTSLYHGPITISDSWLATRDPLRQERRAAIIGFNNLQRKSVWYEWSMVVFSPSNENKIDKTHRTTQTRKERILVGRLPRNFIGRPAQKWANHGLWKNRVRLGWY
jgi:hypothetical protein